MHQREGSFCRSAGDGICSPLDTISHTWKGPRDLLALNVCERDPKCSCQIAPPISQCNAMQDTHPFKHDPVSASSFLSASSTSCTCASSSSAFAASSPKSATSCTSVPHSVPSSQTASYLFARPSSASKPSRTAARAASFLVGIVVVVAQGRQSLVTKMQSKCFRRSHQ